MPEKAYIGFYIDPKIKEDFQVLCIRKGSDITAELKKYIEKAVTKFNQPKTENNIPEENSREVN